MTNHEQSNERLSGQTGQPAEITKKAWHKPTLAILQARNTLGGMNVNVNETIYVGTLKLTGVGTIS